MIDGKHTLTAPTPKLWIFISRWLVAALIGISLVVSLVTLMRYPQPTCDETSYASAALSVMSAGSTSPLSYSAGMPGAQGLFSVLSFGHKLTSYNLTLGTLLALAGRHLLVARLCAFAGWLIAGAGCYA